MRSSNPISNSPLARARRAVAKKRKLSARAATIKSLIKQVRSITMRLRSPLLDPAQKGSWGKVNHEGVFDALSRIIKAANPKAEDFPRISPMNLAGMVAVVAGQLASDTDKEGGTGWDNAFENAPILRESGGGDEIEMSLKARRGFSHRDQQRARQLRRGRRGLCLDLSASDPHSDDDAWGSVDNLIEVDVLFDEINKLIRVVDRDGVVGEFEPCKPEELAPKLKEVADQLEAARQEAITMRLAPKPKAARQKSPGITPADRMRARRLRGLA